MKPLFAFPGGQAYLRSRSTQPEDIMSIISAAFTIFLYFLTTLCVILLGLTFPLWIGFVACYIGVAWIARTFISVWR